MNLDDLKIDSTAILETFIKEKVRSDIADKEKVLENFANSGVFMNEIVQAVDQDGKNWRVN